jgi:non-specific serine/threonine protein kinase
MGMLGIAVEARGDPDRAEVLFEQSLALARTADVVWLMGWMVAFVGRVAMVRGEYHRATARLEESLQLLGRCGDRQGASWSFQYLGSVAERRGEYERAIELYESGLAASRDVGDKTGIAWALGNLGRLMHARGEYAQAIRLLEESLDLCRALGDHLGATRALGSLGRVALDQHDYQRAAALFEENLVLCRDLPVRERRVAYALHYLGVVARELGHGERAARLFGAADAFQERAGRSRSQRDDAEVARQVGALREMLGDDQLDGAWAAGRSLSVDQAIEYALTAPSTSRVPARACLPPVALTDRGDSLSASLSTRELEVVALLARGLTNRQVAEALVISERTASTHVTHILNKLGFTSRAQVAAWAVEHGVTTG